MGKNHEVYLITKESCQKVYEVLRTVKFIDTEGRMVVAREWGEWAMGRYCLMGTKFQFGKMKKVLDMDGGSDYTTM